MADFKNIQRFVEIVEEENTKDDDNRGYSAATVADRNRRIDSAIKLDNALEDFISEYGVKKKKAAEIFEQSKALGFIDFLTKEDNERVTGEIILVTQKGKELIRSPKGVYRFIAWLEFRNKLLVLVLATFLGGVIGNIDHIVELIKLLTKAL